MMPPDFRGAVPMLLTLGAILAVVIFLFIGLPVFFFLRYLWQHLNWVAVLLLSVFGQI